jgi:hypothetical protein
VLGKLLAADEAGGTGKAWTKPTGAGALVKAKGSGGAAGKAKGSAGMAVAEKKALKGTVHTNDHWPGAMRSLLRGVVSALWGGGRQPHVVESLAEPTLL